MLPLPLSLREKGNNLFRIERPVQFRRGIATTQHGNDKPVALEQRLALGDIDQLDQQTMIDERHENGFGHFAQVAPDGAEELAFRQHGGRTRFGMDEKPILGRYRPMCT
jgi:hypothetical protein